MSSSQSKTQQILEYLQRQNENIRTLSDLLDQALQKLEKTTNDLANPEICMSAQDVREKWITREEVKELLDSRALLEECRKETDSIYSATTALDQAITPIMDKYRRK